MKTGKIGFCCEIENVYSVCCIINYKEVLGSCMFCEKNNHSFLTMLYSIDCRTVCWTSLLSFLRQLQAKSWPTLRMFFAGSF